MMNDNHCEKSSDNKHVMVYSKRPLWGGGYNVECKYCGMIYGFSRDGDEAFLIECNVLAQKGLL